jgi:hypothetical protein
MSSYDENVRTAQEKGIEKNSKKKTGDQSMSKIKHTKNTKPKHKNTKSDAQHVQS